MEVDTVDEIAPKAKGDPGVVVRRGGASEELAESQLKPIWHEAPVPGRLSGCGSCVVPGGVMPASWRAFALGRRLVGMVRLDHAGPSVASLSRLRVLAGVDTSVVVARLIDAAAEHCSRHGYLKLIVPTQDDADRAARLLNVAGVRFAGRRGKDQRPVLEFYVDLYRRMTLPGPRGDLGVPWRQGAMNAGTAPVPPLRITSIALSPGDMLPPSAG